MKGSVCESVYETEIRIVEFSIESKFSRKKKKKEKMNSFRSFHR